MAPPEDRRSPARLTRPARPFVYPPPVLYRLANVGKSFGPKEVLAGATWQHDPGRVVGLVGRNGAGKTTVLKIVQGLVEPDEGERLLAGGTTFASLEQAVEPEGDEPLRAFVARAQEHLVAAEREMRRLEEEIASRSGHGGSPELDALLHEHDDLRERFARDGGYEAESRVERVLTGVGLPREAWGRPVGELSGGQKHRAQIARLLLTRAIGPPPRRADEPSRRRRPRVPRGVAERAEARGGAGGARRLARPPVPERRLRPDRRGGARRPRGVPRRLRHLPEAQGRAGAPPREGRRGAAEAGRDGPRSSSAGTSRGRRRSRRRRAGRCWRSWSASRPRARTRTR